MSVRHRYTKEEELFLIENSKSFSRRELAEIFNQKYGTSISVKAITNKCNEMQSFGKSERHSIGDEVVRNDGYVLIKVTNDLKTPQYKRWVLKHRIVWEKNYGEIPKDKIIIFKDGNKENCDISNLAIVDRKSSMIMAKNSLFNENSDITEVGINIAKLLLKLSEAEKLKREEKRDGLNKQQSVDCRRDSRIF